MNFHDFEKTYYGGFETFQSLSENSFGFRYKGQTFNARLQLDGIDVINNECLTITIREDDDEREKFWIDWLGSNTSVCLDALNDEDIPKIPTREYIGMAEMIAKSLGYKEIYLHDIATVNYMSFSTYLLFKEGRTFYERYGFRVLNEEDNEYWRYLRNEVGQMPITEVKRQLKRKKNIFLFEQENQRIMDVYVGLFEILNDKEMDETSRDKFIEAADALDGVIKHIMSRRFDITQFKFHFYKPVELFFPDYIIDFERAYIPGFEGLEGMTDDKKQFKIKYMDQVIPALLIPSSKEIIISGSCYRLEADSDGQLLRMHKTVGGICDIPEQDIFEIAELLGKSFDYEKIHLKQSVINDETLRSDIYSVMTTGKTVYEQLHFQFCDYKDSEFWQILNDVGDMDIAEALKTFPEQAKPITAVPRRRGHFSKRDRRLIGDVYVKYAKLLQQQEQDHDIKNEALAFVTFIVDILVDITGQLPQHIEYCKYLE